ncbi:MAG: hypothetical protein AABZ12_03735 [Planctomycetota bacterium]
MPAADRTTIKATFAELLNKFRTNLVADPPTAAKPFRKVAAGDVEATAFPRPLLVVRLLKARPVGIVDDDKLMEVTMALRVAVDVADADAYAALLDRVAAVDDYLDGLIDVGVIDGADGFDERHWAFGEPRAASGARLATAEGTQTCVVKVQRGYNRTMG